MSADDSKQDAALSKLSTILERLETTPHNVTLIKDQIHLMLQLQMTSEVLDATLNLASLVMLSEDEWLAHLDLLITSVSLDLEAFVTVLERFERAEQDYLSLAILIRHVEFIIGASKSNVLVTTSEVHINVDPEVQAFLIPATTRDMVRSVVAKGNGLLSESHLLWQPWIDWEMSLIGSTEERIHELFAERMAIPHSTVDTTSSMYSSYCSENCPSEYEQRLVTITSIAQPAKFKWSGEKRFGKTREMLESELAADPAALTSYIDWETDPRAKHPQNERSPTTDPALVRSIFERAVAFYGRAACSSETALAQLPRAKKLKGKEKQEIVDAREAGEQALAAYKTAEASLWERYASWTGDPSVRVRAVRACPSVGSSWRHYLNQSEQSGMANTDLAQLFDKALSLGLLKTTNDIADIFVCRAASLNRLGFSDQDPCPIIQIASQGFDSIHSVSRNGDPSLRLEKFLLDWGESRGQDHLDSVLRLLDKPAKSRASAYQMVIARANVEARIGLTVKARETFCNALQRTDLDWPEAVFEAFIQFETVHGDLATLSEAMSQIEMEQAKLARRREKAARLLPYEAATEQSSNTDVVVTDASVPSELLSGDAIATAPASSAAPANDGHFKRDREHTTILVTGLADDIQRSDVEAYFTEIGHVRDISVITKDGRTAAVVEFRFADAVPIALQRDGKKLGSTVIHVSMLWRSNLFVTNFPRETDDAALREMFSQYGTILDTRWPGRKYADSRRFCYITMDSPVHAQEALVLNGMKLGDFPLTVLISDPSAKAKRTDTDDSANRTLFVGGLTAKTTEHDVELLLRPYGEVQHVKLGWDPIKRVCKGFAFVQMGTEEDAKSSLALDGSQRQGKFLKVQMSDPNHANKKPDTTSQAGSRNAAEKRLRSIRLHNLPEGTQEGLLQQALEKLAPVKRVEVFARSHEAIAELENQSDVGKLLLRSEPFVFNGTAVTITQQDRRQPPKKEEATSSLGFAPRAARRGGKAIGKPRNIAPVPVAPRGQEDFRQLVQSRNSELEGKRKAEEILSIDAKRQKAE